MMKESVKIYHSEVDRFKKNFGKILIAGLILIIIVALSISHKGVMVFSGVSLAVILLKYYGLFLHRYKIEGNTVTYRHFYDVFTFNVMSIAQIDNKYLLNARSDLRHGIYGSGSRKDMIRIVLRNGEGLNVSPANRKDFIKHLLSVNPSIEVAL